MIPWRQKVCNHPLTETVVTPKAVKTTCIFCDAEVTTGNPNKPKRRRHGRRNRSKTGRKG
jgi:hypothetical protein